MSRMVIVGAGEAGVRAAFALREAGHEGPVTLLSGEDALPYERPPLSKEGAGARPIRPGAAYAEAGIDLRLGAFTKSIDAEGRAVEVDGERLPFDALLLATGARARAIPALDGCLTLRTDRDAAAILSRLSPGARLGVIGGGFIGLELAALARARGAEVTVVEAAPRLMARAVPAAIAERVAARHRAEGVDLRLGAAVAHADASSITLATGETLSFDCVVAGVGAAPETALAEDAGIDCEDGILVDARFETSAPGIFAAGDCCRFPWRGARVRLESWRAAQDMGAHAARAMLGARDPYARHAWFWSDQYDLGLQVAGLWDPAGEAIARDGDGSLVLFQRDVDGRLAAAAGVGPGQSVAKDIKLAERLIERGARIEAGALADPDTNLKRLLKAA